MRLMVPSVPNRGCMPGQSKVALHDINFELEDLYSAEGWDRGEFQVLLGPSGCSQSTILNPISMHEPQQMSDHLDRLVKDVEQTEEPVREVESNFGSSPLTAPDFESGAAA